MGRLEALDGNYALAAAEFSKAIETDPALADAHYYTGMSLLKQTKFAEAAEEFRKEIERNPQHAKDISQPPTPERDSWVAQKTAPEC